jgi:cob(I)alamin adenosyltransferase
MILVITGNGKGKTTSAIGSAVRALGWDKSVAIVFFDKGGSHYGEQNILNLLQEKKLDIFRFGLERFNEKTNTFRFENTDKDKTEASAALKKAFSLYNNGYFLIICDEIINAMNLGLVDELEVRDLVNQCPENIHLMLTGRNAPGWLIEKADLVSEIGDVKHYFKKQGGAVKGLDY